MLVNACLEKNSDEQSVQDWFCFERILETIGKLMYFWASDLLFTGWQLRFLYWLSTCMCCMLSYATVDRMPAISGQ